jgi:hypothetical protein
MSGEYYDIKEAVATLVYPKELTFKKAVQQLSHNIYKWECF